MLVLGIETSCDETAIAVVEDGQRILSNVIGSQVEIHARYGGVVPEVASRQHTLAIVPILRQALGQASTTLTQIDAICVTNGPGLAGALLVGVNFAKGLALALGRPFLGVNHLEAHLYAAWLEKGPHPDEHPGFPLVCLLASGGHTDLILMRGHDDYAMLGRTRDDAAGEAFDKAARVLGLGFPGGPAIQRAAQGISAGEPLPRSWLKETWDFSFSGLKTALLRRAREQLPQETAVTQTSDDGGPFAQRQSEAVGRLAAGFQEAVVEVLVVKTVEAALHHRARGVLLGGGVAANALLRGQMQARSPVPVLVPRPVLCTDNGAMVAACGHRHLLAGQRHGLGLDAVPNLRLG